jgi:hypothetical protein
MPARKIKGEEICVADLLTAQVDRSEVAGLA